MRDRGSRMGGEEGDREWGIEEERMGQRKGKDRADGRKIGKGVNRKRLFK